MLTEMEKELELLLEENNQKKYCAHCNTELEKRCFKVLENFLQVKFYTDPKGEDNMFCSEECILKSLFVEEIDFDEEKEVHHG